MKNMNKWIVALLLLSLISALLIGCNQDSDNPTPTPTPGTSDDKTTTQEAPTQPPVAEYGNFSLDADAKTSEQIFATNMQDAEQTFGQGSSYTEDQLTNIYQVCDYIANYEQYVEEYGVQEQLDKLYAETGFTLDLDFAADMMKHYLDSTGEAYDFSASMTNLLTTAKINSAQSTNISAAMTAAENLVKNGQSGAALTQKEVMRFTSLKSSDGPAFYALGNFFTMTDLADVQRTGDTYSATVTFRILDFYDWKSDSSDPLFTDVLKELDDTYRTLLGEMVDMSTLENFSQTDIAQLHNAGYAQSYISTGTIVYTITWTAGQTFDNATILTINGEPVSP